MMSLENTFNLADYIVFCVAIACSLIAGLYYAYKERNQYSAYRFHRGGGKLRPIPVALSMLVTFESSIFFLGVPAEIYVHGSIYWWQSIAMGLGFSSMFLISIPLFFPLQITSVYEYLQLRYGSEFIRQMATTLSTVFMVLYSGIVLFGSAIALEAVTQIPKEIAIVGMVFLAVAYTSLGGIKAVVATDAIQGVVMIAAIFAVLIYGTIQAGGIEKVIALNKASGRLKLVDFDINPLTRHTVWTIMIGTTVRAFGFGVKQPVVQRLNSTRSKSDARKVAAIVVPGFVILEVLVMIEGLVAFAYFSNKGCDPLASGQISNPNQIMSYTVADMFAGVPGVPGLFLAAICSATLSTVSSLLSSVSAIISEDIIKTKRPAITDKMLTVYSRILVLVTGVVSVGIALLIGNVKGPITQISGSILGAVDGPLNCIFFMSIFVTFTTRKGLVSGALVGMVLALWISSGYNFSPGRKQTPWLPLGPTDTCTVTDNTTTFGSLNISHNAPNASQFDVAIEESAMNITEGSKPARPIQGLDYLYSISYLYIPVIVVIASLATTAIVSKFTQPAEPAVVPPELMLSVSKRICGRSVSTRHDKDEVEIDFVRDSIESKMREPLSQNTDTYLEKPYAIKTLRQ